MSDHKTLAWRHLSRSRPNASETVEGQHRKMTSPTGSYTYNTISLDDVMEVIQPLLAKHGLAWSAIRASAYRRRAGAPIQADHSVTEIR